MAWDAQKIFADGPLAEGWRAVPEAQRAGRADRVRKAAPTAAAEALAAGGDTREAVDAALDALFGAALDAASIFGEAERHSIKVGRGEAASTQLPCN